MQHEMQMSNFLEEMVNSYDVIRQLLVPQFVTHTLWFVTTHTAVAMTNSVHSFCLVFVFVQ